MLSTKQSVEEDPEPQKGPDHEGTCIRYMHMAGSTPGTRLTSRAKYQAVSGRGSGTSAGALGEQDRERPADAGFQGLPSNSNGTRPSFYCPICVAPARRVPQSRAKSYTTTKTAVPRSAAVSDCTGVLIAALSGMQRLRKPNSGTIRRHLRRCRTDKLACEWPRGLATNQRRPQCEAASSRHPATAAACRRGYRSDSRRTADTPARHR